VSDIVIDEWIIVKSLEAQRMTRKMKNTIPGSIQAKGNQINEETVR